MAAIAIILAIVALACAVQALSSRHGRDVEDKLSELSRRLAALESGAASASAPVAERIAVPVAPPPVTPPLPPPLPAAGLAPEPPGRKAAAALARIEEGLMRRWFVWLGAVALALGVVFLVRYSIERGLFGPAARIASGIVLGLVLLAAGEWTRRRPPALSASSGVAPDYIPAGLSAAGIVGLFASFYGGYALYGLIPATIAFVLLAGVSAAAALLGLLHGRLLALIGFVGAYAVPALIGSEHPSAAGLLAYVVVVTAGALVLLRWLRWPWLGWAIAAGAMVWGGMALLMPAHEVPLGLYLLVTPILFVALSPVVDGEPRRPPFAWGLALADAVLMLLLVIDGGYSVTALTMAVALSAFLAGFGLRDAGFDRMAWIGGALQLAVLAAWEFRRGPAMLPESSFFLLAPPTVLRSYLAFALAVAASFGVGGAIAMARAERPQRWAFLAAAMPVAILAIAYWRGELLATSLPWAAIALALAAINVFAVERQRARGHSVADNAVIAAFAVSATAAIALGMTMSLRLGWLSVALSLQLPALVWLFERTQARAVRQTALVMAAIVLVRLLFNPSIADYEIGERPIFNGLLYLYGIPWLAFVAATRGFRRSGDDLLVQVLECGAITLFVALVSLEIRHAIGGSVAYRHYDLLEQGLHSDAWLAVAYGLLPRGARVERPVRAAAWRLLLAAAVANLVLFPLMAGNPLWRAVSVGTAPILDSLLVAYLVPAIFGALFFRAFRLRGEEVLAKCAGIAALLLGFVYLSLEARHIFQGAFLAWGRTSDAEWYVYSALWLAYAVGLMLIGLLFEAAELRLAGLGFGAVVVIKIFVFDMAALSGLYRAASFLALGASLVGLGYLHQRLAARAAPSV